MAYNTDGLSLKESGMSNQSWREWLLDSQDTQATVNTDGYVTDAEARGMKVGDLVYYRQWTTVSSQNSRSGFLGGGLLWVLTINNDGSADLSDGTAIDATDSD